MSYYVTLDTPIGKRTYKVTSGRWTNHSDLAPGLFINNLGEFDCISPSKSHVEWERRYGYRPKEHYISCRHWVGDPDILPAFWIVCCNKPAQQKMAMVHFAQAVLDYWPDTVGAVQICPFAGYTFWSCIQNLSCGNLERLNKPNANHNNRR